MTEISDAAKEQALGVSETSQAVSQLDTVTQQNASMAEETTAASHKMKADAQDLFALTCKFQMPTDASTVAAVPDTAPKKPTGSAAARAA